MSRKNVWTCKIGFADSALLPPGADGPMRDAVSLAFFTITGHHARFIFSGWGGSLDEIETAIVEETAPGGIATS